MLTIITAATVEPITLAQAKAHLRVAHDGDDALITAIIAAAREAVELETGRALAVASYEWTPDCKGQTQLPLTPVTITSADGVLPVAFTTAPAVVPAALISVMLLMIGHLYENAEATITAVSVAENKALGRMMWQYRANIGL